MTKEETKYSKKLPTLPATVQRIELQKKNKFRYSLFSSDDFILGVSESTLTALNLKKGTVITPEFYTQIETHEERWAIKDYLLRLLGRRDHASHELRLKALKKDFKKSILDDVIFELEEKGYINNYSFAKKFVHDKFEFNKWGPNKIRMHLIKKNIDKKIIDKILIEQIPGEKRADALVELILKKKRAILRADPEKRRKKIFDYLLRKGFNSNVILSRMDELLKIVNT